MSEQIREQVSAFLDGELPSSETELLLKRLTRDEELRQGFGRYALIGEAMRGTNRAYMPSGFLDRVNRAVDGERVPVTVPGPESASGMQVRRAARWWRPLSGVAVAAGVAAVSIVALQQRASSPELAAVNAPTGVTARQVATNGELPIYTTPAVATGSGVTATPASYPGGRMTRYVFAHSRYSTVLGQSSALSSLLTDADEQEAAAVGRGAGGAAPRTYKAP